MRALERRRESNGSKEIPARTSTFAPAARDATTSYNSQTGSRSPASCARILFLVAHRLFLVKRHTEAARWIRTVGMYRVPRCRCSCSFRGKRVCVRATSPAWLGTSCRAETCVMHSPEGEGGDRQADGGATEVLHQNKSSRRRPAAPAYYRPRTTTECGLFIDYPKTVYLKRYSNAVNIILYFLEFTCSYAGSPSPFKGQPAATPTRVPTCAPRPAARAGRGAGVLVSNRLDRTEWSCVTLLEPPSPRRCAVSAGDLWFQIRGLGIEPSVRLMHFSGYRTEAVVTAATAASLTARCPLQSARMVFNST
ncbi:hypothetical protein EVAR_46510_1 [Eumeta japonica]|uniref:Uncharacterized protein n=1 Tax=Eumeta variegata TaxID=151549 RepID=A0A4C1WVQ4_EUMVA|nr:hypothetical protein EVAR_46510_1 [Eumeta japonica]